MQEISVGRSDYRRSLAKESSVVLRNRFFEYSPVLNSAKDMPALVMRPALRKWIEAGNGHIRKVFSEPGTFDDDAFVVSGLELYRISRSAGTATLIGSIGTTVLGDVSMAATGAIGDGATAVPQYLFIADGGVLWVFTENGAAIGHLQASGAVANADTVTIDGVYYKWTNGSVDTGTPAGTSGSPWLVNLGASTAEALTNLYRAINNDGTAGTDYSTALVDHPTVAGYSVAAADLYVTARTAGAAGNSIAVSETGANIAWAAGTLSGGGADQLRQVGMPLDLGAVSIAHFNSYIIVIPAQDAQINGRFYWINPGETFVDALDFATAERSPDAGLQAIALSDRFLIGGQTTTETWITSGNPDAPMQRYSGVLYDRGILDGSMVRVKDVLMLIDEDCNVLELGGGLKPVSRPDIVERIRQANQTAAALEG